MTRTRRQRLEIAARVAVAVGLVMFATLAGRTSSKADSSAPAVTLRGTGSWGPYKEIVTWQDALASASSWIDMPYTNSGSPTGRENFLAGDADFVISGTPFTDDELAELPSGADDLIAAPVQVTALSFLLKAPHDGLLALACDPYDPATPDPRACTAVKTPYTGPVRVPNDNLVDMIFRAGVDCPPPANPDDDLGLPALSWNCRDVLKAMNVPGFAMPLRNGPLTVSRSGGSASNYYLQQWAKTASPEVWAALQAQDPNLHWEPITERLPHLGNSREAVDQQAQQLALSGDTTFSSGAIAPLVPSAKRGLAESSAFSSTATDFIEIKNANGDWVAPTPDSIDAAVDAGGDTPLYALTHNVPGAYPLVWVNNLYVHATGLSIDKTEAAATVIRYLATDGQNAADHWGEGRLSPELSAQALAAADDVVASNCVGTDREIVKNSDPGRFAPPIAALSSIGSMLHCQAVTVPTTTATATPSPPASASSGGTQSSGSTPSVFTPGPLLPSAPAAPASDVSAPTTATTAPKKREGVLLASNLPMGDLGDQIAFDEIATFALGAALYLLLRPVGRMLLARRSS